jgi:putative ABC transport system permease protein
MFNLEKAIREWKKELAGKPALDETYISELEAVLRDEIADRVRGGESEESAYRASIAGMGESRTIGGEFSKVRSRRGWGRRLGWHYIRISLRKIRRQKGYSAINIAGLAVGLACCILMMLWVGDETSFDRFHENRDSIYRAITERKTETSVLLDARAFTPLGPVLKAELPEVVDYCRYTTNNFYGFFVGDKMDLGSEFGIADPSFFTMFSFPFVSGDPKTALAGPQSIVLTERLARKFFGGSDPMGRTLLVSSSRDAFTVTGVIRDVPENSHLHFDCVIPAANMSRYHHVDFENWQSMFFCLYVRLTPKADPAAVGRKMAGLLGQKNPMAKASLRLQPLRDVHLKSDFTFDTSNYAPGSASTLTTFSVAALAVLLLACINFMNLATARSANRAKEVGLRKVAGGRRSDLVKQFLGESVVLSFVSLALAIGLAELALPLFNNLAGKQLALSRLFGAGYVSVLLGFTVLTGLLAGSYPAVFLSAFRPAAVLKNQWLSGGRGHAVLRKGLVIVQFGLTVFLLIGTLVVDKQLRYVRDKNLGIDTHQVVDIMAPVGGQRGRDMKNAMLANPAVLSISRAVSPGAAPRENTTLSWEGKNPDTVVSFLPVSVDEDYPKVFRTEMAEGRFFSADVISDRRDAVVVNETAARAMGPNSPMGKRLTYTAMNNEGVVENLALTVIGVMKDFHQTSLHRAITPMLFVNNGASLSHQVRIHSFNIAETMKFLEKTWKSFVPNWPYPFTFSFLDDRIDGLYKAERKVRAILGMFSVLALFTACLGLSGLAAFLVERRKKEIGIRKVLGASIRHLVLTQTREFGVWILAANVVAWPAAYFVVGRWLQSFAYHVRPGVAPAVIAALFSLAVALLAVGYKTVRASLANPVDSLKYE